MKYLVYLLLTAGVFIVDINTGYNLPVWVLYIVPILYALKTFKRGHVPAIAITSILILVGFFLSPPGGQPVWAILHRVLDIAAFWVIWFFALKQKTSSEKIKTQAGYIQELASERKKLETVLKEKTEIETDLRESEERFRSTFENAAVGIAHTGLDGRWLMVNDKLSQITGYTKEELLEKNFKQISHPGELDDNIYRFERLVRGEIDSFSMEKRYIRKDGQIVWGNLTVSLKRDRTGKPLYLISIIQDISPKKHAEAGLLDANRKLSDTLESITDGFISLDYAWRFLYVNEQAAEFMNKKRQELVGKVFWESVPEAKDSAFKSIFIKCMSERVPAYGEGMCPASGIWLSCRCYPSAEGISVYLENINKRKEAEELLSRNEALLKEAGQLAHVGAWDMEVVNSQDLSANQLRWSDETFRIFGYKPGEVKVTNEFFFQRVRPEDGHKIREAMADAIRLKQPYKLEHGIIRPDGAPATVLEYAEIAYDENSRPIHITGAVQDITELKRVEEALQASLHEKEILLRELYHRTKNNMQVISSFLHMQFSKTRDKKVRQMFNDTQNRIRGMSMVHEKLYRSKDLSRLDLGEYTKELAGSIIASYKALRNKVTLSLDIEDIPVSIDAAIPWGLILNELVSNSLKYAFPGDRKGEITISMHRKGSGEISVSYSDNGVGFPPGFNLYQAKTLGMRLILNLVYQLNGNLELENGTGVLFKISFKDRDRKRPEMEGTAQPPRNTEIEERVNSS